MFQDATSFNQDVSGMNVGAVTTMDQMFQGASAFNQDLCAWGTAMAAAPIPTVSSMFASTGCADTSNPDPTSTPVTPLCKATCFSEITNANDAVDSFLCDSPTVKATFEATHGPIGTWEFATSVTSFEGLFDKARVGNNCADADYQAFNEDISGWKMPGVQNMATMFQDATSFNQDISSWDVGEVTTMDSMF